MLFKMLNKLYSSVTEHETQINFTLYVKSCEDHEANEVSILKSVSFTSYVIDSGKMSRDDTEKNMLDVVNKPWNVHVDYRNETFFTLKPKIVGYSLHDRLSHSVPHNCSPVNISLSKHVFRFQPEDDDWQSNFSSTITPEVISSFPLGLPQGYSEEKIRVLTFDLYSISKRLNSQWSTKDAFIDITSAIFCPFVEVRVLETLVQTIEQITFRIQFEDRVINVLYEKESVTYVDEDTIHICVDRFKELIKLPKTRASFYETTERVHYYFEVSCFSVSTACLILTLLTYCLFPGLRSVPGKNNMALCLSLALAQISLLVSVELGARGWLPSIACATNALLLHLSWLSAFAWMSVCCFHMYRVFSSSSAPSHISAHSNKRRYRYYFLIAHGSSCLLVLATVLVHLSLSGGRSFGYDTVTCFLDTSGSGVSFVLSLLVPLCAMIVCNTVLFSLTVWHIVQVTRLQQHSRVSDRRRVMTYVKLSTVTGLFWALAILSVRLDYTALNFLTSVLVALQGLYIFLSFTVNRAVGSLYKELIWPKRAKDISSRHNDPSGSTSQQRQMTESTSNIYTVSQYVSSEGKEASTDISETQLSHPFTRKFQ
ncbi:adhesion G-protein coupled receptor G6-like [Aplysia californica]|uniref:Adhesion G-protein coupled receptor G6-like n=1 Tax=Aplysia californica TaxID=6500 RepID=A0ABM1A222_APLCA|nr:adhesion G-protein coupled receptor G6-like [Aplysia californica]